MQECPPFCHPSIVLFNNALLIQFTKLLFLKVGTVEPNHIAIVDQTRFELAEGLSMDSLFPYADDLFRAVFGKGLSGEIRRWFPEGPEPQFNKKDSRILLRNFMLTLGVPRGLEFLIEELVNNQPRQQFITLDGKVNRELAGFESILKDRLQSYYKYKHNNLDPTGIIATIGALCMELDPQQNVPNVFIEPGKSSATVSELASKGVLVPFTYNTANGSELDKSDPIITKNPQPVRRWCCPMLFYDADILRAEPKLLANAEDVIDPKYPYASTYSALAKSFLT